MWAKRKKRKKWEELLIGDVKNCPDLGSEFGATALKVQLSVCAYWWAALVLQSLAISWLRMGVRGHRPTADHHHLADAGRHHQVSLPPLCLCLASMSSSSSFKLLSPSCHVLQALHPRLGQECRMWDHAWELLILCLCERWQVGAGNSFFQNRALEHMAVLLKFCLQLWFSAATRNRILFGLISWRCIYSSLSSKSCASHTYGATSFQSDHHRVVRCHKLSNWPPPQAFKLTTVLYGATSSRSDHPVVRCHKLSVWPPCCMVPQALGLTTLLYGATSSRSDHRVVRCHKLSVWPPCGTVPQAFSLTTMWYGATSFQSDHRVVRCHKLSVWPPCCMVPQAIGLTTMWYVVDW